MTKILILGANGMLGTDFVTKCQELAVSFIGLTDKEVVEKISTLNLEVLEKNAIIEALKISKNKSAAAKLLNISRFALMRRMEKHNLH